MAHAEHAATDWQLSGTAKVQQAHCSTKIVVFVAIFVQRQQHVKRSHSWAKKNAVRALMNTFVSAHAMKAYETVKI